MMIHEITALAGKYKQRKRIGRGPGSGSGKQAGRGHKGAGSRAGNSRRYQFEGGQMPFFRRMPKFGFSNAQFRTSFWIINLGDIVRHEKFAQGGRVDAAGLVEAGLVRDTSRDVKILGWLGEGLEKLPVKLEVEASRVSASARRLIEDSGGSVNETGTRKDRVRGIDRNSGDPTPKNQTKKLRERKAYRAKAEAAARGEVLKKK